MPGGHAAMCDNVCTQNTVRTAAQCTFGQVRLYIVVNDARNHENQIRLYRKDRFK